VSVGGTGVSVGGTGVSVGGTGVGVSVGTGVGVGPQAANPRLKITMNAKMVQSFPFILSVFSFSDLVFWRY
jgi:hypothetical protein